MVWIEIDSRGSIFISMKSGKGYASFKKESSSVDHIYMSLALVPKLLRLYSLLDFLFCISFYILYDIAKYVLVIPIVLSL
jgi:hypothetical protein